MNKEKQFRSAMSMMTALMLFVAFAVLANGQEGSARRGDQCAEKLAKYKKLAAQAAEMDEDLRRPQDREYIHMGQQARRQIGAQMETILKNMKSLGCTNLPNQSGSDSELDDQADRPTHVPEPEDAVEYTESPEPRYLNPDAFIEKMQPPDSEAEGTCGDLSGRWQITTSEGSQIWEIWNGRMHPRVYGGRKVSGHGGQSKMLAALLDGNMLKFQFDAYNDEEGVHGGTYTCKLNPGCQSSLSPCKLNYDRNRRGSFDATFKRLGPLQRQ